MNPLLKGAAASAVMVGRFAVLMVPGFWLRFGMFPWEAL
jgi:hypothetical protein